MKTLKTILVVLFAILILPFLPVMFMFALLSYIICTMIDGITDLVNKNDCPYQPEENDDEENDGG